MQLAKATITNMVQIVGTAQQQMRHQNTSLTTSASVFPAIARVSARQNLQFEHRPPQHT